MMPTCSRREICRRTTDGSRRFRFAQNDSAAGIGRFFHWKSISDNGTMPGMDRRKTKINGKAVNARGYSRKEADG